MKAGPTGKPYAGITLAEKAELRADLPGRVQANGNLVDWLTQRVENYRNRDAVNEDGDTIEDWPEWKPPRARDLRAARDAVKRLEQALDRLDPRIVVNALTSSGLTKSKFFSALYCLDSEASKHEHNRGKRKPGPSPDRDRRDLQAGVAQDLHNAGFRLTTYPGGVLARTLEAAYVAAGIAGRKGQPVGGDSLFPTLQRLVAYWSPQAVVARRQRHARFFG